MRQLQEEKKRLAKRGLDAATTTVPVTVGGKSKSEKGKSKSKSKSNISSSSSKMASKMTMADIRQLFEHDCDCASGHTHLRLLRLLRLLCVLAMVLFC